MELFFLAYKTTRKYIRYIYLLALLLCHKYARKNFQRRKVTVFSIAEFIQCDFIEMQPYKRENRNYRYILIAIDVFSKISILDKTAAETTKAMERIILRILRYLNRKIFNMQTDDRKEFFNSKMKEMVNKYKINHYSTFTTKKASVIERLIRTLKRKLYMEFSLHRNYKWIQKLDRIIDNYNNTW